MTPARRLCFCGNFPELQDKFIADVSALRRADPLAPLTVIVSGHLVGLALKRELAWSGCSHANVSFRLLADLAAERAEKTLTARGLRTLNDVTHDAIMARAIELCGALDYFAQISTREGFRRAAWKTLDGLRSAGVTLPMLRKLHARLTNPASRTLQRRLGDLVAIRESLERCMQEHKFVDAAQILELATEIPSGLTESSPVIFYGPTEYSELERRFVATLLGSRAATVYLPYRGNAASAWVKPLYEAFGAWGFTTEMLTPKKAASALLSRVQLGLFEEITPQDSITREDDSLVVISAPSREREAEETVRNVLYSPLADSHPQRRSAILLREGDPYTSLLRGGFAQAGIQGYFHQCQTLGDTAAGRALKQIVALLDEKYRRAHVMEFLLTSPVKWSDALSEPLPDLPVAEWNQFSLLAGIVSGRDAWRRRLEKLHARFLVEQARAPEDNDDERLFRAERAGSLAAMNRYVGYLFARMADINRCSSWRESVAALWTVLNEFVETRVEDTAIWERLCDLEDLDALGTPLTLENLRQRVAGVLSHSARRTDRFQVHEPTVAPLSAAAGVLFDEVFIPGLVEKELPRPVPADPLLLDDERKLLQTLLGEQSGATIPTHAREHEREMFLFHTALCSARRRIVLSYPRREESTSRDRLPSTYLLKVVEAVTSQTSDYAALETFIASSPQGRRIPVSRLKSSAAGRAATTFQYHEAMLAAALNAKSCNALLYLIEDHPFFARAVEADFQRFREKNFGKYDGVLEDPALRRDFQAHYAGRWPALHPGHLERFASCPFRYFVNRVLDVQPVEEPPELQRITPYERAIVMRDILDQFYRAEQAAGRLPLQYDALERLRDVALKRLADFEQQANTGVRLLWQIDRARMLRALTDFVTAEMADTSGYVPEYFGQDFVVRADGDAEPAYSGRLDRVDISPDGTARVIVYKTGRMFSAAKDGSLLSGRAMHLPIYRLAATALSGLPVESAADYYVAPGPKIKKAEYTRTNWANNRDIFLQTAGIIEHYIASGTFFPFPEKSKCANCGARAACGAGRMTAKWAYDLDQTRGFRALAEGK